MFQKSGMRLILIGIRQNVHIFYIFIRKKKKQVVEALSVK